MKNNNNKIVATLLLSTAILSTMEQESDQEKATQHLFQAIYDGDVAKAERAIEFGAKINKKNKMGLTPLLYTMVHSHLETNFQIFSLILATPDIRVDEQADDTGYTALWYVINAIATNPCQKKNINNPYFKKISNQNEKQLYMLLAADANPFNKIRSEKTIFEAGNEEVKEKIMGSKQQ